MFRREMSCCLSPKFEYFSGKKSGFDWHMTLQNSANKENKYNKMLTIVEVSEKFMSAILDFSITWEIGK